MKRLLIGVGLLALCSGPVACVNKNPSPSSPSSSGGSNLSTDATDWVLATSGSAFSAREDHSSLVFDQKMWVMGGYNGAYLNDTWYSTDGVDWSSTTANASGSVYTPRADHASVVFNNAMWVLGGSGVSSALNDTWHSTDGVTWVQAAADGSSSSFPSRYYHTALVFNGKMWVLGGSDASGNPLNDVWSSTDGSTWTQVAANGSTRSFPARYHLTSLVFNNRMWVLGGDDSSGQQRNDVWSSADGSLWTQAAANGSGSSFTPRASHTSLVFDGAMWVLGGIGPGGALDDAWYSTNGTRWTQAAIQNSFTSRYKHSSVVFNNAMWVIGGIQNGFYVNDVWHSP